MARPREFDTDLAIDRAMRVFWANGYGDASLPNLLAEMGIARGSLYKAFRSKKSLFLLALERYDQDVVTPGVDFLADPGDFDGWERIIMIFEGVVEAVRGGDRRGCLICTAAAGAAPFDPDIAAAVNRMMDRMRGAFEVALAGSRGHSKLEPVAIRGLADALTTQYVGLRVLARSRAPLEALDRSVASLGDLVGPHGADGRHT